MNIRIRYFASFREIVGKNEETFTVATESTVHSLQALLLARYPQLASAMSRSVCAVNHRYVSTETVLHDGDELVFIPPTGGGRM